ncbi:SCO-spondin-like isoform X3 [Ruditapes philippinarum]|uniref:SCO-spondin-like isoform X3 n=1 Tax=Ruditapes philippinarum TaxID=129788 RepID=UPI00295AC8BD|nr:SCO-spondin-like isoform X3 [Ruditapes philippinarum]
MKTVVNILKFLSCMTLVCLTRASTDLQIYEFTRNVTLSFPGQRLVGHVFDEFSTKKQVIHCAFECLKSTRCKSFNYEHELLVCQLNDGDHFEFSQSLVTEGNSTGIGYHHRDAFSIEKEALGPCATDPCENGGRCLDTVNSKMERTYYCICTEEWMGQDCETPMNSIEWDDWEDWGPCSVTCETGWTTRRRRCMDVETGETKSSSHCYGRDVEYQACTLQSCPRWLGWSEWGPCSTSNTCGQGTMQRYRNCSNGGVPGRDRFCLGFTTETAPCKGINCRGMLTINNTLKHGDGRIQISNDLDAYGMSICADDNWNFTEIDVACKQIGFQGAYKDAVNNNYDISSSTYGSPIYKLHCEGGEKTIQQCPREHVLQCSRLAGIQCRVRGGWSLWSGWGECSVTCENGTRTRTRDCNHPPPNYGGTECPGEDTEFKPCTKVMCPIDGVWATWSPWSECDVTCENGTRFRTRNCTGPFYNGAECPGESKDVEACFPKMCPVNGIWNEWVAWTECSHTCGYGNRNRSRTCHGPFHAGLDCQGSADEREACNTFSCPVDGDWKMWTNWGNCSEPCGGGLRNRTRECVEPEFGGAMCVGPAEQAEACNQHECPIDGIFSEWEKWSECSVTCANGTRFRNRECFGPYFGGANCTGPLQEKEVCVTAECPVDGIWDSWQPWQECNVTCGGGRKLRQRKCIGPYFGGANCEGSTDDTEDCNTHECPVDGEWELWSSWETCNVTCGGGSQRRNRNCIAPLHGGDSCTGSSEQWQECNTNNCPVDGEWETWMSWSNCNVSCGGGASLRQRVCHEPQHGGADCEGAHEETMECGTLDCSVDGIWEMWSNWTECTKTCGTGVQTRNRTCTGPFNGGAECDGDADAKRDCNENMCPVDGIYGEWSEWSSCSLTCGRGTTFRNRTCFGPYFDGAPCQGPNNQSENCFSSSCPVHGLWKPWSEWTACSTSCENGTRSRNRTCDGPYYGGDDCDGKGYDVEACFLRWCPVDGVWEEWTKWDTCPVSCGGSVQNRTRSCFGPFHDGANCTGPTEQSQDCNTDPCPVDGAWTLWSKWNECNVTCGGGTSGRFRFCTEAAHGGSNCTGPSQEFKDCNTQECPIDGKWEAWSNWTECSYTCGTGKRKRSRDCDGPFYGGANCTGPWDEIEDCNTHECPVDGKWDEWASWSACNVTCGGGGRWRSRNCTGPFHGGAECPGQNMSSEACNTHECPIDGVWTDWTGWEICPVTCGGGNQSRFRNCTGPFYGGANCTGVYDETRECNTFECPVDGVLSEWSEFYSCNATCGGGIQWRNRTCIGPFHGGANCTDPLESSRNCNMHECPIDGVYNLWSPWESCDVTCGKGIQWRNRTCDGPFYGGAACDGPAKQNQTCNDFHCPVDGVWESWTKWDECSVTCGGAVHSRYRNCTGPFYGGANCSGPANESRDCNTQPCPVDGVFNEWGSWYECNVTCGGGIQWRNRTCKGPFHNGADCQGAFNESQECNTEYCPVDGVWLEWQAWQGCSTTCGGGTMVRDRECKGPFHGGQNCDGSEQDSRKCAPDPCPIPGDWFPWSYWSLCTVTCNGGNRQRYRQCNWESYGNLTTDCEGPAEEIGDCHTFSCEPLAIHCADWASRGLNQSCVAEVDPDGEGTLYGPVEVECDFDTEPGKAVTVIHHDQENVTQVRGYEGAGEFQAILNYVTGWGEAIEIVDASSECAQFMRWDCKAAIIHNPFDPDTLTTFWKNRTEQMTRYFGGATPGSDNCACGETNSCFNASLPCNCDINDDQWRFDEGWVTNKAELPIHSFYAGDTGAPNEAGIFQLGPLLCH